VIKPLEKTTGLTVRMTPYPELAKLKAMVDTNTVDLDIWEPDGKEMLILGRRDLLEPIDYSLLPPSLKDDLLPAAIHKYGVGEVVYGAGLVYATNSKVTKQNHPRNWVDFWDVKKFPGPRTMPDPSYQIGPIEPALIADGVDPAKLYPLDIDRAFRSLDK